jgi:hypothetical protein
MANNFFYVLSTGSDETLSVWQTGRRGSTSQDDLHCRHAGRRTTNNRCNQRKVASHTQTIRVVIGWQGSMLQFHREASKVLFRLPYHEYQSFQPVSGRRADLTRLALHTFDIRKTTSTFPLALKVEFHGVPGLSVDAMVPPTPQRERRNYTGDDLCGLIGFRWQPKVKSSGTQQAANNEEVKLNEELDQNKDRHWQSRAIEQTQSNLAQQATIEAERHAADNRRGTKLKIDAPSFVPKQKNGDQGCREKQHLTVSSIPTIYFKLPPHPRYPSVEKRSNRKTIETTSQPLPRPPLDLPRPLGSCSSNSKMVEYGQQNANIYYSCDEELPSLVERIENLAREREKQYSYSPNNQNTLTSSHKDHRLTFGNGHVFNLMKFGAQIFRVDERPWNAEEGLKDKTYLSKRVELTLEIDLTYSFLHYYS